VSLGVLGLLNLTGLFILFFVLHILLVNFFWIVFANEYRLIKPNHLNLGVLCNWLLFSILLFFLLHL
jgi:hypothetical protein